MVPLINRTKRNKKIFVAGFATCSKCKEINTYLTILNGLCHEIGNEIKRNIKIRKVLIKQQIEIEEGMGKIEEN